MKKQKATENKIYMGVDLGTTNSAIAVIDPSGVPTVIANMDGDVVTTSVVSVAGDEPTVGKIARADKFLSPEYVSEQFKRYMGQTTESSEQISLVTAPDGTDYSAVMLSAEILNYLKKSAEKLYDTVIETIVVSVPAYFDRCARQATSDAALVAGFEQVFLIDEPTAAATYYGLSKGCNQTIAVFDFGGGTFDISILAVKDGSVEPLAIDGDAELGGSNVDEVIFEQLQKHLRQSENVELSAEDDLAGWLEARDACRQAKEILAHRDSTTIAVRVENNRYSMELTRNKLRQYSADIIETLKDRCRNAMQKAGLETADIDKVVLIGGSTRLKFVPEIITEVFNQEPVNDADPDLAVAKGNAVVAAAHFGKANDKILLNKKTYLASAIKPKAIAPRDLCVAAMKEVQGDEYNVAIVPCGAKLPYESVQKFTPLDHRTDAVEVKIIDGPDGKLSSDFTPFKNVKVRVKPTDKNQNGDRIEFKVAMNCQGLVNINVRDILLNEPVPLEFDFDGSLSQNDIRDQRDQLKDRHED